MAESQVPYPNLPAQIAAIRESLSEPRFGAYLSKGGGNEGYALALYLYNARVAKAFMFPLGVVEITLRNAIDALFVTRFGPTWHLDANLRDHMLTPEGLSTLDKAIARAGPGAARGRIVAELTFDFWSNLFRPEYGALWRTSLNVVFPNIKASITRHDVQTIVKAINRFRNRVAHHEPVLDLNITDVHAKLVELVGLRCSETAAWLKHHSTVAAVTRTRPRGATAGFVTLASRLAPDFVAVSEATMLDEVMDQLDRRKQAAICTNSGGAPTAVFGAFEIARYIATDAKANAGLTAPSERAVKDLLATIDVSKNWATMADSMPLAAAVDRLKEPNIQAIVGLTDAGEISGIILRAHRRY